MVLVEMRWILHRQMFIHNAFPVIQRLLTGHGTYYLLLAKRSQGQLSEQRLKASVFRSNCFIRMFMVCGGPGVGCTRQNIAMPARVEEKESGAEEERFRWSYTEYAHPNIH